MNVNNLQLETIKISWFSHILHFSRTKPSIYKPNDFKLTSVFKNRAAKSYNTTEEVLAYLDSFKSDKLLLELEKKGFLDLVELYNKTSMVVKEIKDIENEANDLKPINKNLNSKLKSLKDRQINEINENSLEDWNNYLKKNSNLISWVEIDSGQRRNGKLLGSFYCEWVLDTGYIDLYLRLPLKSDPNWYLKIVHPMLDGYQTKSTIQSKNFLSICAYITGTESDIEIKEFISCCKDLSKDQQEITKITNLFLN